MDIDFALILFLLVVAGTAVWLFDRLTARKARHEKFQQLLQKYPDCETDVAQSAAFEAEFAQYRPGWLVDNVNSLLPVIWLVFIIRSFLVEPFQIPSESMVPTLEVGDFILVNKFSYGVRMPVWNKEIIPVGDPQRGDVMVFFPPHKEQYFIKRVIGVPGDVIEYRDRVLTVNGQQASYSDVRKFPAIAPRYALINEEIAGVEHEIRHQFYRGPIRGMLMPVTVQDFKETVKPDHYFMMGDNRDNSRDSRAWGQVHKDNIVGKAFARWMFWDDFFSVPSFHRVGEIK